MRKAWSHGVSFQASGAGEAVGLKEPFS
jgi:hypothetical protein